MFVPTNFHHQRGAFYYAAELASLPVPGAGKKIRDEALSGLPLFLDLFRSSGLFESISRHIGVRTASQGWTDAQMVSSLVLLQLAGGECVDDLRVLEADTGFSRLLLGVEHYGLPRRVRRELEKRWRKSRTRTVPSPSSAFRYLSSFHDPWWWITVLAFNLQQILKRLVLGGEWVSKRMKAIRFSLIALPGRVARHAGSLWVQVNGRHPSLPLLLRARSTIAEWAMEPVV